MWSEIRLTVAIVGTALSKWLGGFDGLLEALVAFMLVDYLTGIFCAITEKTLSSAIGFKGIFQKCLIILLVGMANSVDQHILGGNDDLLRTAVIFFYLSNEGISIVENAGELGLPLPQKLKNVLEQLHDRADKKDERKDEDE